MVFNAHLICYFNWNIFLLFHLTVREARTCAGMRCNLCEWSEWRAIPRILALDAHGGDNQKGRRVAKGRSSQRLRIFFFTVLRVHVVWRRIDWFPSERTHPVTGFSRQAVELLRSIHADFSSFDILNDEEVRPVAFLCHCSTMQAFLSFILVHFTDSSVLNPHSLFNLV